MPARHHLTREYEMGLAEEMLARWYSRGSDPAFRRFALELFGPVWRADFEDLGVALWDAAEASRPEPETRAALAKLVRTLFAQHSRLTDPHVGWENEPFVLGLLRLADLHPRWMRPLGEWECPAGNPAGQFASLARHLLARYPVPDWTAALLFSRAQPTSAEWFLHLGAGRNLRTAPGLPVPLTRKMAHLALEAPEDSTFVKAVRWGQVLGFGGSAALAAEIGRTALGRDFGTPAAEAWWSTVLHWLARQGELELVQVGPLLDYLRHRKAREPELEMKGRTLHALTQGMEAWHRQLRRERRARKKRGAQPEPEFASSGLRPGVWRFGRGSRLETWVIEEILSPRRLWLEGAEQSHCVGSYEGAVRSGQVSIWSLGVTGSTGLTRRVLTLEVANADRAIVQARGRHNRWPEEDELRFLRLWAQENALRVELE